MLVREVVLIPAHAVDHGAGRGLALGKVGADAVLEVRDPRRAVKLHVAKRVAEHQKMAVTVVESRHRGAAFGVDDFAVGWGRRGHRLVRSDRADHAVDGDKRFCEASGAEVNVRVSKKKIVRHDENSLNV